MLDRIGLQRAITRAREGCGSGLRRVTAQRVEDGDQAAIKLLPCARPPEMGKCRANGVR